MLTDKDLRRLTESLIDTVRKIEMEMLLNIARFFQLNSKVGGSAIWQLEQLNQLGLLHEESLRIISRHSGKTLEEVKKMIGDAAIQSIDLDTLDDVFSLGLAPINPRAVSLQPIIETFQQQLKNEMRLVMTSAVTNSNLQYQKIVDKVVLETTGGFKSYSQSIQDALNQLAEKGITATRYTGVNKNGLPYVIEYPLEASVRRSVFTAINQVANASNEKMIEELNPPQIAVSQHLGARNTGDGHANHEAWQGKAYDNDGTFERVTGYGDPDMLGLGGFNCRHVHEAYYPGISPPLEDRISNEENAERFKLEQRQRQLERAVRDAKKRLEIAKQTEDKDYIQSSKKLRDRRLQRLDEFTKEHGLTRDYSRERIAKGYANRSTPSQNPLGDSRPYDDVTQSWLDAIDHSKIGKVIENDFFEADGVRYDSSNAKLDVRFGRKEREYAEWLTKTFHEDVYLVPRVEKPDGVSTPDYIFKHEKWDHKELTGDKAQSAYRAVRKKSRQSNNFMFDISKFELSTESFLQQVDMLFGRKDARFVEKIMVTRDGKLIKIVQRKKK